MMTQLAGAEYPHRPAKIPDRVLVVDGEPFVRWALTASLSAAGYDVVTATTGEDACELAARTATSGRGAAGPSAAEIRTGSALFDEIRRVAPRAGCLVLTTERRGDAPPAWLGAQVIEKPFDLADVVRLVGEAMPSDLHAPRTRETRHT